MSCVQRCMAAAVTFCMLAVVSSSNGAYAAGISTDAECRKALVDTQGAYDEYEGLGPKGKLAFAEIMKLAEVRCDEGEFKYADQLLTIARSMVATD